MTFDYPPRAVMYNGPKGIEFISPYIADFVEHLHYTVSNLDAKFDYDVRVWILEPHIVDKFLAVAKEYYSVLDGRSKSKTEFDKEYAKKFQDFMYSRSSGWRADHTIAKNDWALLGLLPGQPRALIDAAYRTMAKIHHPDSGGSNQRMAEINATYERLKVSQR